MHAEVDERAAAGLGFDGIDLGYYWSEDKRAQEMKDAKKLAEDLQLCKEQRR